jgi:hypothetical protein
VEGHSSRLEQVEDRISELKDKTDIKEKILTQLKSCERNMQELNNVIKRPNMRILGIEEGKEVQVKEIHNIFNKIRTENFPNLRTGNIEGNKREKQIIKVNPSKSQQTSQQKH